ncbi:MAG: cell division protein WhiA [Fusobacteriaceae bacterium]|jgi:DNA-binding protein WhiA|nr:hypothetical protein [Fusobacteriales bacterium]MDN5304439.1 cell division protein WhiA [Fusobacteriaceae bacterium]
MSYTNIVKEEVFQKDVEIEKEKYYELLAILKCKNAILDNKIFLKIENLNLANRIYKFLKDFSDLKIYIKYSITKSFGEHKVYIIEIPYQKGYNEFIKELNKLEDKLIRRLADKAVIGFTRGAFLATGYIKEPNKEYALDFFIDLEEGANLLYKVLKDTGRRVFITQKKNKHLVYLRNSEDIMDILVMIGAVRSFFEYEEITMVKDIKNKTIREMNWEVANEMKTLDTAQKQIKMINYIVENYGLENLSEVLKEAAVVRLNNPEASLTEIASKVGISKSGIRNRFRRLEELYNELIEEN